MALNTSKTYLAYVEKANAESATAFIPLPDIKTYPDMLSAPGRLDATSLANLNKTYIEDIRDTGEMTFDVNYDPDEMMDVVALQGKKLVFRLYFGSKGADGYFEWEGTVAYSVTGGGVSGVREASLTTFPETDIKPYREAATDDAYVPPFAA